jgi:chromosome segregation ATPase
MEQDTDMSTDRPWLWAWAQRQFARIAELKEEIQKIDREYSELLKTRRDLLVEIESLEERVRPIVQSALASEMLKWSG